MRHMRGDYNWTGKNFNGVHNSDTWEVNNNSKNGKYLKCKTAELKVKNPNGSRGEVQMHFHRTNAVNNAPLSQPDILSFFHVGQLCCVSAAWPTMTRAALPWSSSVGPSGPAASDSQQGFNGWVVSRFLRTVLLLVLICTKSLTSVNRRSRASLYVCLLILIRSWRPHACHSHAFTRLCENMESCWW